MSSATVAVSDRASNASRQRILTCLLRAGYFPAYAPRFRFECERSVGAISQQALAQSTLERAASLFGKRHDVGPAGSGARKEWTPVVFEGFESLIDHERLFPYLGEPRLVPNLTELAVTAQLHVALVLSCRSGFLGDDFIPEVPERLHAFVVIPHACADGAAGPRDPSHFGEGFVVVGDKVHDEHSHRVIERSVFEPQFLCVTHFERHEARARTVLRKRDKSLRRVDSDHRTGRCGIVDDRRERAGTGADVEHTLAVPDPREVNELHRQEPAPAAHERFVT